MKKTKFIALTLVIAVVLMGAGYAAWTDVLTINNNVETGYLNVVFDEDDVLGTVNEEEYITVEVTPIDDQTISVDISNLYPDSGGGFSYKIINKGSIPAKFESVSFENLVDTGKLDANNVLTYIVALQKYDKDGFAVSPFPKNGSASNVQGLVDTLDEDLANWDGQGEPLVLNPGEYLVMSDPDGESLMAGYFVTMPANETGYEDAELNFDLKINFKQWNQ